MAGNKGITFIGNEPAPLSIQGRERALLKQVARVCTVKPELQEQEIERLNELYELYVQTVERKSR